MGFTYADITLVNAGDMEVAASGLMPMESVRMFDVRAFVDSGASSLVIGKNTKEQLGLRVLRTTIGELADGSRATCEVVGPVEIRFKNRATTCDALVLSDVNEVLLGVIPIEGMDVIIDPLKEELTLPPDRQNIARYYIK
ncbi:MAG: aspartyl protease family protein [Planctomycetaceae bacterium]|jgi:clan AA aspartic protease|nr:aspartyl protease family protein [Planctomycetaceae bacterium]